VRTAAALCFAALAVAGCGGAAAQDSSEEFSGGDRDVAATVERLETAARDDDPQKVCTSLLADKLLGTLSRQGTNCATAVREAIADTDSFDLTVKDVEIGGRQATVKVESGVGSRKKEDTLRLERDGSAWKFVSLG